VVDLHLLAVEVDIIAALEALRHFRVIVIDVQTIRNGKIAKTYPVQK
jgi:hypothetical protein